MKMDIVLKQHGKVVQRYINNSPVKVNKLNSPKLIHESLDRPKQQAKRKHPKNTEYKSICTAVSFSKQKHEEGIKDQAEEQGEEIVRNEIEHLKPC